MSTSASASTSTHAPSPSSALHPTQSIRQSNGQSSNSSQPPSNSISNASTHPSTLPHSPETLRQIAEARAALEASMLNIGNNLSADLKSRAQNLHSNSAQLDKQLKDVDQGTKGLKKENDKLGKMAKAGGEKIKELGNVQNWAEMLERDFLVLEETLRLVKRGEEEEEGSEWSGSYSDVILYWRANKSLPAPELQTLFPDFDQDANLRAGSGSYSGSEDGERDDESLEGDRRRERIGAGFGVNEEEMGFLDVYGLSEDSAMEGVETEQDEMAEGKRNTFGDNHMDMDGTEKTPHQGQMDEFGYMKMNVEPGLRQDKGKGKEVHESQIQIEHHNIDVVGGSSTGANGSNSNESSHSIQTAPSIAASLVQTPETHRDDNDAAGSSILPEFDANTASQSVQCAAESTAK